jgi:hypothetical protein
MVYILNSLLGSKLKKIILVLTFAALGLTNSANATKEIKEGDNTDIISFLPEELIFIFFDHITIEDLLQNIQFINQKFYGYICQQRGDLNIAKNNIIRLNGFCSDLDENLNKIRTFSFTAYEQLQAYNAAKYLYTRRISTLSTPCLSGLMKFSLYAAGIAHRTYDQNSYLLYATHALKLMAYCLTKDDVEDTTRIWCINLLNAFFTSTNVFNALKIHHDNVQHIDNRITNVVVNFNPTDQIINELINELLTILGKTHDDLLGGIQNNIPLLQ